MRNSRLVASFSLLAMALACGTSGDPSNRTLSSGDPHLDTVIGRALTDYFTRRAGSPVRVSYDYLRSGPTVAGIAYPKYYVWVRAEASRNASRVEGPARIAVIDDSIAAVTHFFARDSGTAAPVEVDSVFPAPVVASIRRLYWH